MQEPTRSVTVATRHNYDPRQVEVIRRTVARDCNDSELALLLELSSFYELNPFAGQIYAVKMGSRDGAGGRVTIMTSRDGFLAIANRHADFRGMVGDVVRKGDSFKKTSDGVIHEYEDGTVERGPIIGAWAMVHRADRLPTYFFARWSEYQSNKSTWKQYPSAMILKVAEAMALRKAYSLTGLVAQEEMDAVDAQAVVEELPPIDWGQDADVSARLQAATSALGWREPLIRAKLNGLDEGGRHVLLMELESQ